jgi:hypothetical protein
VHEGFDLRHHARLNWASNTFLFKLCSQQFDRSVAVIYLCVAVSRFAWLGRGAELFPFHG